MASSGDLSELGLRERKKARTRAAIQRHALRLFREQGYDATTVSQIAEAAEVSESTFFRYFPSKEEVVLWDEFDPRVVDVLLAQPPEVGPIRALRIAIREVLGQLSPADREAMRERTDLMLAVPELRMTMLEQLASPMQLFARIIAERSGRKPDDPAVRALVGAIVGVSIGVMFAFAEDPTGDLGEMIDEALGYLEAGLPI
ncbi:MAG: TetR family transcriptional regulator [Chloroflexi bacterium]|nr:MAG: TetR family transcriptional regulator [Chloroflexota bacterium]